MRWSDKKGAVKIRTAGIILLIIGALLALSPFLKVFYFDCLKHPQLTEAEPYIAPEASEVQQESNEEELPDKLLDMQGRLVIPKIDLDVEVDYGVGEEDLKKGPGFYPQSGCPDTGNVSIAGHRNAYGAPFWHLDKLESGDQILLYYNEKKYEYRVDSVFVTHSRDWSVIDPTDKPALTLTTCHPLKPVGGAYDRLIVRAFLKQSAAENK